MDKYILMEKTPGTDDEIELGEDDFEIIDDKKKPPAETALDPSDLYTFAPGGRKIVPAGSVPITVEPTRRALSPVRPIDIVIMHTTWVTCQIIFPDGYTMSQDEWGAFGKEHGFFVFLVGHMLTLRKKENANLAQLVNTIHLLIGTGIDMVIRFPPQREEFRPNKPK